MRKSLQIALLYGAACGGVLFLTARELCISLYGSHEAGQYLRWFAPLAVLLYCGGACEPGSYEMASMYLVLRAPDDVCVAEIGAAAVELSAGRFWTIEDFTSLLETYYGRHGRYYQGRARLEIYWQDALLGSADLTLE